ncbi:MAG: patatin-like phospholipase family protein, partial [Thermoanaerobaculales bacterium]|nr:patatin-like phospholipase family protein [Thermoanaerobaculales bacterium]
MTDTGTDRAADRPTHTDDRRVVFAAERLYLEERRRRNGLPSLDDEPDLWGLAFSGGGVRSATFCLGVMQALTTGPDGLMKRFDYLSTVSGGGYIGSCLSSLLSGRDDTGLDHATSPFTGLREHDDYDSPDRTELGVRHQIHHLRTHGEYLIPRSRLMSRDVQRAVGSVVPGIFHTVTLFLLALVALVAATHLVLAVIEPDLETLAPTGELVVGSEDMSTLEFVAAVPKAWLDDRIAPPVRELWRDARARLPILALLLLPGVLWNLGAVALATRLARTFDPESFANRHPIRSGWTAEEEREARFVARFNLWSVLLAVAIMLGLATGLRLTGPSDHALATLLVPLALALGGFAASHVATYVWETKLSLDAWRVPGADTESRFRRSLHASIRGACIYGVVVAAGTPVVLVILSQVLPVARVAGDRLHRDPGRRRRGGAAARRLAQETGRQRRGAALPRLRLRRDLDPAPRALSRRRRCRHRRLERRGRRREPAALRALRGRGRRQPDLAALLLSRPAHRGLPQDRRAGDPPRRIGQPGDAAVRAAR